MILEDGRYRRNGNTIVVRICDECGKREEACLGSVKRGRRTRGKDVDLCRKCSYLKKYVDRKKVTGKKHHSWKHGLQGGYKRITIGGVRIREHRYIYEQFLGRKLTKAERVHHIDFNKLNNDINNLILFKNNGEHRRLHMNNIERCALFFLDSDMWFNFKKNLYVLTYDKYECFRKDVIVPNFSYTKKEKKKGVFYTYIDFDGKEKIKKSHIPISEKIMGRKLYSDEVVHHIDGIHRNDDPNNLIVLSRKVHCEAHYSLETCLAQFFTKGKVKFCKKNKEYYIAK